MSIFASLTKNTIAVPFDPPQTVTVRKLTGGELERVQAAHARGVASGRGWANRFRVAIEKGVATDAQTLTALADPLIGYDRLTMIDAGLIGWSYSDTVSKEQCADLDDEAMEFIATEILKLTKPGLFKTAEELQDAQKNG